MKSTAAVLWDVEQPWSIEEIDIADPTAGEVLIEWKAAGLCHSDDHMVTGDMVVPAEFREMIGMASPFPMIGGHEGAGIVLEVGPGVTSVAAGDLVSTSFIPACGVCRYCVGGRQNLCKQGAELMQHGQMTDGVVRHHCRGEALMLYAKCGTFARHTLLSEQSVIKVDPSLPAAVVALVSCGVATGVGSATHRAQTQPGDVVVVVGCGGIGMNAVQGAALAGARSVVAIEPVTFKREAALTFGATHTASSMKEAFPVVQDLTQGEMAERVIMCPGVMHGDLMEDAMNLTAKGGTCVVTGVAPMMEGSAAINLMQLAMLEKEVKGTIFGSGNPRNDIPNLLALYQAGKLQLDELVTRTYALEELNQGYEDMREGRNIRGVILFDQ